jgi:hypothetical protein
VLTQVIFKKDDKCEGGCARAPFQPARKELCLGMHHPDGWQPDEDPQPCNSQKVSTYSQETGEIKEFAFDYSYWSHDSYDEEADGYMRP